MPQQRAPGKQAENQTNITYEGWAEGAVEHFLGIDIGGTKLLTSLFDGACRATHSVRRATGRELSPKRLVALVADVVKEIRADGAEVDSLGLGFPGLVNSASPVKVKLINAESYTQSRLRRQRNQKVDCIIARVAN